MVLNADAYRAHLDAHPVADDDAIDLIRRDLVALHPKFTDSDHCRTCGDVYPCPALTSAAHHGLNTGPR